MQDRDVSMFVQYYISLADMS